MFRTRAKVLLEKLVSVSRDEGRSAAQDRAIIMDSRMSEFKGKLTFVRRAVTVMTTEIETFSQCTVAALTLMQGIVV